MGDVLVVVLATLLSCCLFLLIAYVAYAHGSVSKTLRELETKSPSDVKAEVEKLHGDSTLAKIYAFLESSKKAVAEEKVENGKCGALSDEDSALGNMFKTVFYYEHTENRQFSEKFFKMLHIKDYPIKDGKSMLSQMALKSMDFMFSKNRMPIDATYGWDYSAAVSLQLLSLRCCDASITGVTSLEFDGAILPDKVSWDRAIAWVAAFIQCRCDAFDLGCDIDQDIKKGDGSVATYEKYRDRRMQVEAKLAALLAE